jgi:hypothetical protein
LMKTVSHVEPEKLTSDTPTHSSTAARDTSDDGNVIT